MGTVTVTSPVSGDGCNIKPEEISSHADLQQLHDELLSAGWRGTSVSFNPPSKNVAATHIYGSADIDKCGIWSSFRDSADLRSFVVKSDDGRAIRFALDDDSVAIDRLGTSNQDPNENLPNLQMAYLLGICLLYTIYLVDNFIDQNGLRPVVDEVKERRWAIMLACAILAVYY
jgi:hypothetical protein